MLLAGCFLSAPTLAIAGRISPNVLAGRISPNVPGLARHGFGASGAHSIPVHPHGTALHSIRDDDHYDQIRSFFEDANGVEDFLPESDGGYSTLEFGGLGFKQVEPIKVLAKDRRRIEERGGVQADSWRADMLHDPKLLKRLPLGTEQHRFAVQNELLAIQKMLNKNVFLTFQNVLVDAGEEDAEDAEPGVTIVTENYAGTLHDLMVQHDNRLDVLTALDLFLDISDDLAELRRMHIAHDAPALEEILVAGDLNDLSSCRIVLCSSLANTNMRIRSPRANLTNDMAFQDQWDSLAKMRTTGEIKEADLASLSMLFKDLVATVEAEERQELFALARKLDIEDAVNEEVSNIVSRVEKLRKKWLRRYPLEAGETRRTKRSEDGNRIATVGTPMSAEVDDLLATVQAALLDDVTVVISKKEAEVMEPARKKDNGIGPR